MRVVAGFLTHTGYAHADHGLDLGALADDYGLTYKAYKAEQQAIGKLGYDKIPCINHPVFKNKPVNHDPREAYVAELFAERG
jgi:hypothetical protein